MDGSYAEVCLLGTTVENGDEMYSTALYTYCCPHKQ